MKIIAFISFLVLVSASAFPQPPNINISNGNTFDGEPYLAINPINTQNMVIAWMGLTITGGIRVSIKTKSSFDGGMTWGNYHVQQHVGAGFHSADVSMCFRNDGLLYISYIDYRQNPDSGVIFLSHSFDGGINWSSPTEAWNMTDDTVKKPIDRPWLACDVSSSANNGMLYMTTKPPSWVPAPNRPYLKSSSDSGTTWSSYRFVDSTGFLVGNLIQAPMAALAIAADGALCMAFPSYLPSQSVFPKIYFAKSHDRGLGIQYSELLNNPVNAGDTNLKSGYCLIAHPTDPGKLAYVYVGGQNGDADIFITSTNDGGSSWSVPVRVNDDPGGNGKLQDLPWASYNSTGDLAVTWRDRRNGSGTGFLQPCDIYCAVSHDNGISFSTNFPLSSVTAAFDSVLLQDGNDFMCSRLVGDTICATWGDVRNGKLNIYFVKTSDSTGTSTGIVQVATEEIPELHVYPDPATFSFTITLPVEEKEGRLDLFNGAGKKVFEKNHPGISETVDCSKLSAGIYHAVFTTGKLSLNRTFMITK